MHPFGHIDLRVRDLEAAYAFYAKLLPELGFRNEWRGDGAFSFQAEGKLPRLAWFGVIEDRGHVANATCLAFAVESHEEVDRLAEVARQAGATRADAQHPRQLRRVLRRSIWEQARDLLLRRIAKTPLHNDYDTTDPPTR